MKYASVRSDSLNSHVEGREALYAPRLPPHAQHPAALASNPPPMLAKVVKV